MLVKFVGPLRKIAVPLPKYASVVSANIASAPAMYGAIQRKMSGRGVRRTGKGITLVILNEDIVATILVALCNMAIRRV